MRLIGQRAENGRVWKDWLHKGDDGHDRITTEVVQDVSPIIKATRVKSQGQSKDFKFKADVPVTFIDEASKTSARLWGVSTRAAFQEILSGKSSRAKKVWRLFTEGRDYRKLQSKHYA